MSESTLRKRTAATSNSKEEAEVILDTTEQEEIVHSLIQQAETARDFWLPLVGILCIATCLVPFLLPPPDQLAILFLRLLTIPFLLLTGLSLLRPALVPPEVLSSLDYLVLGPVVAAGLVIYLNGDLFSQRTWGWTVPAAVLGLASEVKGSLRGGVEQARKMEVLMYSAPTA
ncbi:hypothetical protein BCR35DRAFT_353297 [Leucosporidium creatinivorum]|uniref:Uncharacterized protein n=1 Tax=Leucosporidium creatinivorum TaxID=106004 RepID=A0A1Y2EZ73_9BASI|nr:hypothetical protein BCR35DRAFT_353297 [Leucosporidium creatinivorum]